MVIGGSDGQGWRYEVVERGDDFLVRMRDLDTGSLEEDAERLFRTAAVAFAYAEFSACLDRHAAARTEGQGGAELDLALARQRARFEALSTRLGDEGLSAQALAAWERGAEAAERRRLH